MITENTMYNVKNRSSSVVVYRIPETNLRREFAPGETKRIPFGELEKLTYQSGGRELLENFLQILEEEVTTDLNVNREPEYNMSEEQIRDLLLTGSFAVLTDRNKKIKDDRKKALIYNNVISTGITLALGYGIDNVIKNETEKFVNKFKQMNIHDPKVLKYVEGINIIRPALIFAGIYYGILPMFSTYMAERIDKYIQKKK